MMNNNKVHNGISKLQAIWKGYKTRLYLLETRKEYEQIFDEIQENFNTVTTIEWPCKNLCMPTIREKKRYIPNKRLPGNSENTIIENNFTPDLSNIKETFHASHPPFDKYVSSNIKEQNMNVGDDSTCHNTGVSDNSSNIVTDAIHQRMNDAVPPLRTSNSDEMINSVDSDANISSRSNSPECKSREDLNIQETDVVPGKNKKILTNTSPVEKSVESNISDRNYDSPVRDEIIEIDGNKNCLADTHGHIGKYRKDSNSSKSIESVNEFHGNLQEEIADVEYMSTTVDSLEFVETSSRIFQMKDGNSFPPNNKCNVLTDSWNTDKSFDINESVSSLDNKSKAELLKMKENLSLELLWIGQAITSRKVYLHMKNDT